MSLKTERKLRVFRRRRLPVDRPAAEDSDCDPQACRAAVTRGELPVQIEEQSFDQGDALLAEIQPSWLLSAASGAVLVSGEDGLRALRTAIEITERVSGAQGAPAEALA